MTQEPYPRPQRSATSDCLARHPRQPGQPQCELSLNHAGLHYWKGLEWEDAMPQRFVSVCCEAGPVDEISDDGAGRCSRCGEHAMFEPDTWTQPEQTHTPGPLTVIERETSAAVQALDDSYGPYLVADVWGWYESKPSIPTAKANAHRIVASWNACTGIPTEVLEAGVVADLLAACEAALRYDESILGQAARGNVDLLRTGLGVTEGRDLDSLYEDWMSKAHAAIAKAKGE